ncbi:phosphatidylinositol 4-phosphatase [Nematocida sp. LUAm3]|nr:phosphatidylinositol 4-phosphatase [Nematocida sp. LUAm3]KAI5175975.1 phosphatidylinositol 4-phosphatase [Nematocida sp. LUAm2]KAI5179071.1 phosphatidylinositol 4-phosphatase [Nematocida sp. LUAm1]
MHSLENGRMLIRDASTHVSITYLRDIREEEESAPMHLLVRKESWSNEKPLRGGKQFYGIYGEIEVNEGTYLIYVKECESVGEIRNSTVYKILEGSSILLRGKNDPFVHQTIEEFFRRGGLYFSSNFDLSEDISKSGKKENFDFIYNYIPVSKFLQNREEESLGFCIHAIQGYFGEKLLNWCVPLKCVILSRRSWKNAGTRYFSRGCDSRGHAANTVETIFHVTHKKEEFSYLQIRGSVPLSWEQRIDLSYKPPVRMNQLNISKMLFLKHLEVLRSRYKDTLFLTLLDEEGHEKELNEIYQNELRSNSVEYYAVDYHKMSKSQEEKRHFKQALKELIAKNKVIRTNCIDCLDRTNVVQTQISKIKLVEHLELGEYSETGEVLDIDDYLSAEDKKALGALWNENANSLSMQYTGTSALKTDITAHGVRTIKGMIQDVISSGKRYVKNNFTDARMHEAIELMTGVRQHLGNSNRGGRKLIANLFIILITLIISYKINISSIIILILVYRIVSISIHPNTPSPRILQAPAPQKTQKARKTKQSTPRSDSRNVPQSTPRSTSRNVPRNPQ